MCISRSRKELEKALKDAEQAFKGFALVAESMSRCDDFSPEYFRRVEQLAFGHGAIVHVLQWVLGYSTDRGIDEVIIHSPEREDLQ